MGNKVSEDSGSGLVPKRQDDSYAKMVKQYEARSVYWPLVDIPPMSPPMPGVDSTLAERGKRYGSFKDHAAIACSLLNVLESEGGWANLPPYMKQALRVICDKMARMMNGDPYYVDNWHDIQGYAKLVEDIIAKGTK
jgi:hypothetical protein